MAGEGPTVTPDGRAVSTDTVGTRAIKQQYAASLWIVYLIRFMLAQDFFVVAPTLYLYLRDDFGAGRRFQGIVLSAFFITKFLAVFLVAHLNNSIRTSRLLPACFFVASLGNFLFWYAPEGHTGRWWVLAGRAIAGLGTGVDAVILNYVTTVLPPKEAVVGLANMRNAFSAGLVIAPALSLLVVLTHVDARVGPFRFNVYNTPSFATGILFLLLVPMACQLKSLSKAQAHAQKRAAGVTSGSASDADDDGDDSGGDVGDDDDVECGRDKSAGCESKSTVAKPQPIMMLSWSQIALAAVPLFAVFVVTFNAGALSAVNVPLISEYYGWEARDSSIMGILMGVTGLISGQAVKSLAKKMSLRTTMFLGLGGTVLANVVLFKYDLGNLPMPQFIVGTLLIQMTLPCVSIGGGALYRVLFQHPTTVYMGWLANAMGLGRIVGPLWGGAAVWKGDDANPNLTLVGGALAVLCAVGVCLMVFRQLVPFQERLQPIDGSLSTSSIKLTGTVPLLAKEFGAQYDAALRDDSGVSRPSGTSSRNLSALSATSWGTAERLNSLEVDSGGGGGSTSRRISSNGSPRRWESRKSSGLRSPFSP